VSERAKSRSLLSFLLPPSDPTDLVDSIVGLIDGANSFLMDLDRSLRRIDEALRVADLTASSRPVAESVARFGHYSRPEHYCFECATMHLGTAKVLLREAVERFDRGGPKEVIAEKVRRAYEELLGAEDDLRSVYDQRVRELHNKVEDVRKWVYRSGLLASPSKELAAEALSRLSKVSEEVYRELEAKKDRLLAGFRESGCPVCEGLDPRKLMERICERIGPKCKEAVEKLLRGEISAKEALEIMRREGRERGISDEEIGKIISETIAEMRAEAGKG